VLFLEHQSRSSCGDFHMNDQSAYAYDVFISYCQADQDWVRDELLPRFESAGIRWIAQLEFVLGRPELLEIERAIKQSRWTLLILTQSYFDDGWEEFAEILSGSYGRNTRRWRTIPAIKGRCELPERLEMLVAVDLRDADDTAWKRLIRAISPEAQLPELPRRRRNIAFMAGSLPADFVPRPEEYEQLIARLLAEPRGAVAMTAALRGAGGYGKTTLAKKVCHDERIHAAFADGVLWVTLGQTPGDLTGRVEDLIYELSHERPGFTSVDASAAHLARLLENREVLIVLDDAWNVAHLRPFLEGGSRCAWLITTRDSAALPRNAQPVLVDAMRQDEATALLGAGLPVGQETELRKLAIRLGEWPLLLTLVSGALRDRVNAGSPLPNAFAYVNKALDRRGLTAFDAHNAAARDQAVQLTIGVSLDLLTANERARYTELAIFPEDIDVPLVTLERIWGSTGGLDDFDIEELCERLDRLSLLLWFDPAARTIRLHDVLRGYLASEQGDRLAALHGRFLGAYELTKWANLPHDEPYLWDYLAYHLIEARRGEELLATVKDLHYLVTKTFLRGTLATEADLRAAEDFVIDDAVLPILRRSFSNAAHLLGRCEMLNDLAGTLHSRLAHVAELAGIVGGGEGALQRPFITAQHRLPDLPPAALIRTLIGHTGIIESCAISADGSTIVSIALDGSLRIWDAHSGMVRHSIIVGEAGIGGKCAISGDGTRIVFFLSQDDILKVCDSYTGTVLYYLRGHAGSVSDCAINANGSIVVSASHDGTLIVWDVRNKKVRSTLSGQIDAVFCCAISDDGNIIVSGSWDGILNVWDARQGYARWTVDGHTHVVSDCSISADGLTLVSASHDGTIKVWDVNSRQLQLRHTLVGHAESVLTCTFSKDGNTIVSTSRTGAFRVWDAHDGSTRPITAAHISGIRCCAINADSTIVVSASGKTLKLWDVRNDAELHLPIGHTGVVNDCDLSFDGAIGISTSWDKTLKVWDMRTGEVRHTLDGNIGLWEGCAISADGMTIVSSSMDRSLIVWDTQSGCERLRLDGHMGRLHGCAISSDGTMVVSASEDNILRVWDTKTGKLYTTLVGHTNQVTSCAISFDGNTIISASWDTTLKIWDARTGIERNTLIGHTKGVLACTISNDDAVIVSASYDGQVKVWDLDKGTEQFNFVGHRGEARGCAMSSLAAVIVSVSEDKSIKVWDAIAGICLTTLHVDGELYACACSATGEYIVAAGERGVYMLRLVR
jgi:WD40 repeat protein